MNMTSLKKNLLWITTSIIVLTLIGCEGKENKPDNPPLQIFEFSQNTQGWSSFFSDYPVGSEEFYELQFQHTNLPVPLNTNTFALKLSGNNHSDDLMSLIYRKFEGLQPNADYAVTFDVDIASIAQSNSVGAGGSPDLFLGAGGISQVPANSIDGLNIYRSNFEGFQDGKSNNVFKMLGRIGVSDNTTEWTMINRNNIDAPIILKTNSNGELWLMMGTDSGFEATTTLYFTKITIRFTQG
jgi:hypothetical protein